MSKNMKSFRVRSGYLFLLAIFHIQGIVAEPLVTIPTSQVTYCGKTIDSIEHFENIKYAHDTSGPRRFAPPVPFLPPPGTEIDASAPGPACPQSKAAMPPAFVETPDISEDCLHLRIARPHGTSPSSKLPVVIWLHSGGVVKGSAYDPHFDPDNLLTLSRDLKTPIIYVALNYRLTIFGFARTPLLKDSQSLNVGIRDQRTAFQWVKDNIAAFGGDSERITVFGLSAGGTFASLHLVSYGGERGVPFNRVWTMSGSPGRALNMSSEMTEMHTSAVAKSVGCKDDEVLQCLREIPMEQLLDAAMQYSVANQPPAGLFTFIPSVDGDMFPERQSALYKAGRYVKDVATVFGWTQDDGAMNAGPAHLFPDEESMKPAIRKFASSLDDSDYESLFGLYSAADFESQVNTYESTKEEGDPVVPVHYFRISQILRDMLFTCSSIDFGYESSKHSGDLDPRYPNTRLYVLNQSMLTPLWKQFGMPYVGVSHGSDTNYIFNGVFPEDQISESDQELSTRMARAFIRFAATGDPNGAKAVGDEYWPEAFGHFTEDSPHSLNLHVIGGSLGTAAVQISMEQDEPGDASEYGSFEGGDAQQKLQGSEFGAMESKTARLRNEVVAREKLLERCAFINSLTEKLGI